MHTLFERLEIPYEAEVCIIEPPSDFPSDEIDVFTGVEGSQFDVVGVYVNDPGLFAEQVAEGERLVKEEGSLWVATPKDQKASFTDDFIQKEGKPLGLKSDAYVELDDTWEAHKLVMVKPS